MGSYSRQLNNINPNIFVFIWYGVLYETVYNIYRPYNVKFLERMGGGAFDMALYYSLPGLVAALTLLPGSVFLSRLSAKKNAATVFYLWSRLHLLLIAFVPFAPSHLRPLLFVILIALMNLPEALSVTCLQSMLGVVFNGGIQAQAIALRQKFGNVTILVITLVTGIIFKYIPQTDAQRIICYQLFFGAAFFIGLLEVFVFRKFKEPALVVAANVAKPKGPSMVTSLKQVAQDKHFRRFLLPTFLYHITWHAGWPLSAIYQIDVLKSTEIWFAMYAVSVGVGAYFSAGYWNKLINKRGNGLALFYATVAMASNMLCMVLSPTVQVMTVLNLASGIASIGFNTTILNGMLLATPNENRIVYLGAFNTLVNISLFLSPLLSSTMLAVMNVHQAIWLTFAARMAVAVLIYFTISRRKEFS